MTRLLVARALDPALRRDLAETVSVEELPFVRGRTVVPETDGEDRPLIAGHPNYLGVFDEPDTPWIAVTGRWSKLRPSETAVAAIELEPPIERDTAETSLSAVDELAKRLAQLAGVTVPFLPHSPVLIVLLPVDPVGVVDAMGLPGCTPLGAFQELPGGLRIEPDPVGQGASLDRYAAALEEASAGWR